MRPPLLLLLLTFAWLITERIPAAEEPVNPDPKGIFDFSDLDVPKEAEKVKEADGPPPVDDSTKEVPESIRTVLGKLDRFASYKRSELMKQTAAARKVAAEILVMNATKTDAETRATLLEEAKRVESLPPERPLIETVASSPARAPAASVAMGSWKKTTDGWTNTLAADGSIARSGGERGAWRWVDEKRGVLLFDYTLVKPFVELVQIDLKSKPLKAMVLCEDNYTFPVVKTTATEPARNVPARKENRIDPVIKLAANEVAARKETEKLIQSKNTKVAAWLLQQARSLPATQARVIVERASELEGKTVSSKTAANPNGAAGANARRLGGVWLWGSRSLEFMDGGIVNVNGAKGGSWLWAKPGSKNLIAFSLEKDDVCGMAWPSRSKEDLLYLMPMKGKQVEVRR
jgi:hypothetical protein